MWQPAIASRPDLQRLDLERRLVVDLAERRLSEVRDLGAGKAADEALRPTMPTSSSPQLEDDVVTIEDDDAAGAQSVRDLVRAARVMVVVPEYRDDRHGQARRTRPRGRPPARGGRAS